ncbi:SPOR domain-containing protein [Caloramator sp. E03]|uniref:SPOR domain-containing protein n=1 Tax=Caloramator sp. E03 TaxID=2576307 RepID=UPI001110273E|nr:SPOR domain-containing protein [Caloramator sp. E03]QCX32502.1 SPOR domain-containing protein [Caloramator sp. E03]
MRFNLKDIWDKVKNSKRAKALLMFFVVLPLVSIICGSIIAKKIIIPITNKSIEGKNQDTEAVTINNHIYNYYYVQTGVFTNQENAKMLKKELNRNEIDSAIVKDKDVYRVIVSISYKDEFEDLKKRLKELKIDYIVKEVKINSIINNGKELQVINKYIEQISDVLYKQIDMYYSKDLEQDDKNLQNIIQLMKNMAMNNIDNKIEENFKTCNNIIIKDVENFTANKQKGAKESMLENLANEIFTIKSFYDFVSQYYIN